MNLIRRRLFWKVYLTLLSSLVAVALLMGGFWRLMGNRGLDENVLRIRLTDQIALERTRPVGDILGFDRRNERRFPLQHGALRRRRRLGRVARQTDRAFREPRR